MLPNTDPETAVDCVPPNTEEAVDGVLPNTDPTVALPNKDPLELV